MKSTAIPTAKPINQPGLPKIASMVPMIKTKTPIAPVINNEAWNSVRLAELFFIIHLLLYK